MLKGTFCIFDVVTRRDVRVEIQIPGGTSVYSVDHHSEKRQELVGVNDWNNVFVSSVLRSLDPLPVPLMRVLRELPSDEQLD